MKNICLVFILCVHSVFAQTKVSFKEALSLSRKNNLFLRAVVYDSAMANADIVSAGLRPNPVFNNQFLQIGAARNSPFPEHSGGYFNASNRQVWYQFTKQFQTFHKRDYKIEYAAVNSYITQKNIKEAERNLLLGVSLKYLELWLYKKNLDLLKTVKANIDTLVNINKVRLRNEVIIPSELIRTKILFEQYSLQERNTMRTYLNELKTLEVFLGTSDSVLIEDSDTLFSESLIEPLDSMLKMAFEKRPDIAALNYEKDLSKVNEKLQKAYAMPNIEAGGIFNPQNSVSYYGTYLTLPIPFFDRNQGEIQKAKVMKLKSEVALEALKLQVMVELRNNYNTYLQKKDNVAQVQIILNQSKEVLDIVKYAYLKGNTTIIDFLEAQRTFYDAMLIHNEAQYDLKRSQIELLYVASILDKLTI